MVTLINESEATPAALVVHVPSAPSAEDKASDRRGAPPEEEAGNKVRGEAPVVHPRAEDEASGRRGTPLEEEASDKAKQEGDEDKADGADAGVEDGPEGETRDVGRGGEGAEKDASSGNSSMRDKETVDDAKTPEKETDDDSSRTEAEGEAAPQQKEITILVPAESKESPISAWTKRKSEEDTGGSSAKKKKESGPPPPWIHRPPHHFPVTNPAIDPRAMHPQMMHPQMMHPQMMHPQMMHPQMMHWGPQMMHWGPQMPCNPHSVPARGNAATQPQMMLMSGRGTPKQRHLPANCRKVVLVLPPPDTKLGMLLDDNVAFGLPELKDLAADSPLREQIPKAFQGGCLIARIVSRDIGYEEPKTGQQCAELIALCQRTAVKPRTLELLLVQVPGKTGETPSIPHRADAAPPKTPGRKFEGEDYLYKFVWRNMLLDFFSCEDRPTLNTFMKEKNLPGNLRRSLKNVLGSDERLTQLADRRHVADCRREAYDILIKMFPDVYAVRDALVDFFTNSKWDTLDSFLCDENYFTHEVRNGMARMIANDRKLKVLAKNPGGAEERREAVEIIQAFFADDSSQKIRFDATHKILLLQLFTNYTYASVTVFCKEKEIDATTCAAMVQFVDYHMTLSHLLGQRRDCERREEAITVIERLFENMDPLNSDPLGKVGSQTPDSTPENEKRPKSARTEKRSTTVETGERSKNDEFFSPANIKQIVRGLDFHIHPRISRDGSKEITIHNKKGMDENMLLLVLNFVNRVARGRILSEADRDELCDDCAQILRYDHGYKQASGTSSLARTWLPRLEQAFKSGAEARPLQERGSRSDLYTRIEMNEKDLELLLKASILTGTQLKFIKAHLINVNTRTPVLGNISPNDYKLVQEQRKSLGRSLSRFQKEQRSSLTEVENKTRKAQYTPVHEDFKYTDLVDISDESSEVLPEFNHEHYQKQFG